MLPAMRSKAGIYFTFREGGIMSADNRKVSTDALETLGTIIDSNQKRDAIHLAVIPAVAGQPLVAGQDVGLSKGKAVDCIRDNCVGIVDPFLENNVNKGDWFWLVIYPRKITSLRHVWSHPAFPEEAAIAVSPADATESETVAASRSWIKEFGWWIDQPYDQLMDAAKLWIEDHEYTYDNSEGYKDHWDDFPEFWNHYEVVTGTKVPEQRRESFFTCSC